MDYRFYNNYKHMILKRLVFLALFALLGARLDLSAQEEQPVTFRLEYPTEARPAHIVTPFIKPKGDRTPHEGIDIHAPSGVPILAGAVGKVKRVVTDTTSRYGAHVVVLTNINGIRYRVTYGNLQNIQVVERQRVELGALLGASAGDTVKIVIQASEGGLSGFALPNIVNPKRFLVLPKMRLRPIDNGLRLRLRPHTNAEILGSASQWDFLRTPETAYNAMRLAGKPEKWLKIHLSDGRTAFAYAMYLKVVSLNDPREGIPGVPIAGMNLDPYHPNGAPPAAPLVNLGWVRLNYNMSYNPETGTYGNTDVVATYNRYAPRIQHYVQGDNKVIVILTHQFYGEGAGYVWEAMNSDLWKTLSDQYAAYAGQVAAQYAGQNLVYAYQIWNEQDAAAGAQSSVPMPPTDYAYLLTTTIQAIRAHDPHVKIITGGHMSGPVAGTNYARATLAAMSPDIRPDGIAIHPYGRGPAGSPYSIFGTIDAEIMTWSGIMPDTPLWITEWGVLDLQHDDTLSPSIADHATGFLNVIYHKYPGMVAAAVWFGWADGMHNGFGLVDEMNLPKDPLYTRYLTYRYDPSAPMSPAALSLTFDGILPPPPLPEG